MQRTPIVEEDIRFVLAACLSELQTLSGQTLLLTGGSGFVGSYLVESIAAFNLANPNTAIRLLLPTRSVAATQAKWPQFFGQANIEWFEWDGRTLSPPGSTCDFLIHAASPADPASYLDAPMQAMEDIALSTSAVLHYARSAGVRSLLYLSSGAAYGRQPADLAAIAETSAIAPDLNDPASCYGEAKRYGELLCRTSGVPTVIARLFAFMGPYQDLGGSFAVPDFIRQATQQHIIRIRGDGTALRTYCYAADLAAGLLKLLIHGNPGELYNVGADAPRVSILELAELIASRVGNTTVIVEGKSVGGARSRYVPDTSRFKTLYAPQFDLAESLRRTLASYQYNRA